MLHEFVTMHREAIIGRAREKVANRPSPLASHVELEQGVPLALTQLAEMLSSEATATPFSKNGIAESARRHGQDLLALRIGIVQLLQDYGDICHAITELVIEQNAPVAVEELHMLDCCLDNAIAGAVTEDARLRNHDPC